MDKLTTTECRGDYLFCNQTQKTNNMKAFINSLRPSNPFFQRLDDGQRERFNFSSQKNWWIDWDFKFKRLTISFGKP